MAEKCFLSFHYDLDNWRVQQVKNMGAIEEQPLLSANKWEEIEAEGDEAIETWIDNNMKGKKCLIVLVGEKTAGRPWVKYEIKKAWAKGMGVLAIHIHGLKDKDGNQGKKGSNPFAGLSVDGEAISGEVYDPPYSTSTYVYDDIKSEIAGLVKAAIDARA